MRTCVSAGALFSTFTRRSVAPLMSAAFCSGVVPSRVIWIVTIGIGLSPCPHDLYVKDSATDFAGKISIWRGSSTSRNAPSAVAGLHPLGRTGEISEIVDVILYLVVLHPGPPFAGMPVRQGRGRKRGLMLLAYGSAKNAR